jgi:hypothetical protein
MRKFATVKKFVWIKREYDIDCDRDEFEKIRQTMETQKDWRDDVIILNITWAVTENRAKITDKIKEYEN